MENLYCPECKIQVSGNLKRCPNCGSHRDNLLSESREKRSPEEIQSEQNALRNQASQNKFLTVKYLVGLEHLNLHGSYGIISTDSGLVLMKTFSKESTTLPWNELLEIEVGSEADLRSRVTLSRVLLTGIFALGMKKEQKKAFFVSVATPTSIGLFEVNTALQNNRANEMNARIFATSCNTRIRDANPDIKEDSEVAKRSDYEDIEKLGDLLNKGLITQSEFDAKKRQILGL